MGTRKTERWAVTYNDGRVEYIDVLAGLADAQALAHAGIRADLVRTMEKA